MIQILQKLIFVFLFVHCGQLQGSPWYLLSPFEIQYVGRLCGVEVQMQILASHIF